MPARYLTFIKHTHTHTHTHTHAHTYIYKRFVVLWMSDHTPLCNKFAYVYTFLYFFYTLSSSLFCLLTLLVKVFVIAITNVKSDFATTTTTPATTSTPTAILTTTTSALTKKITTASATTKTTTTATIH